MGRHLTRDDRIGIEKLLKAGTSVCKIAEVIGCSERTIYREKIRGHCEVLDGRTYRMLPAYSAQIAQNRADALAEARKGRPLLLASAPGLAEYLETAIGKRRYSPDAAVQEIVLLDLPLPHLSAVTVYRYIYNSIHLPVSGFRAVCSSGGTLGDAFISRMLFGTVLYSLAAPGTVMPHRQIKAA